MNDPWDWAKQKDYQQQTPPPINNTLAIPASGQTQAPAPIHGPPGIGQMAQTILVARGVNRGIDETYDAGKGYFNKAPHDPSKVPVEDRVGKAPATEAPVQAPLSSNSVTPLEAQNAQENAIREANVTGKGIVDGSSGAAPTTATTAPAVAPTSTAAETGAVAGTTTALASSAPTTISEAAMLAEQYGPFLAAQGTTSVPYRTVGNTGKGGK